MTILFSSLVSSAKGKLCVRSVALKMKCEGGRSAGRFSQRRERILDFSSVRVPRTFRNPFVHLVKSLLEAAVVKSFSSGGGWGHAQIFAQANKPEAASPQRPTAAAAAGHWPDHTCAWADGRSCRPGHRQGSGQLLCGSCNLRVTSSLTKYCHRARPQ